MHTHWQEDEGFDDPKFDPIKEAATKIGNSMNGIQWAMAIAALLSGICAFYGIYKGSPKITTTIAGPVATESFAAFTLGFSILSGLCVVALAITFRNKATPISKESNQQERIQELERLVHELEEKLKKVS